MKHEHLWVMCAAASTALVLIAGTATAARSPSTPVTVVGSRPDAGLTVRVSYADLNLAAARDERVLNRRVGGAARFVCEPHQSYGGFGDYSSCMKYAWDGARPQIAQAVMRAHQIAQTGTSSIPMVAIAIMTR